MQNREMLIRRATLDDEADVFIWRNNPITRSMFFDEREVGRSIHNKWFTHVMQSKHQKLFIGVIEDCKIGAVRFDVDENTKKVEISINLNPDFRGKGLSKLLLASSILSFSPCAPVNFLANIKPKNELSVKIFSASGPLSMLSLMLQIISLWSTVIFL